MLADMGRLAGPGASPMRDSKKKKKTMAGIELRSDPFLQLHSLTALLLLF